MNGLRIAVLGTRGFPNVQGGVESHCQHIYTRLAAKGHQITVFARKGYVCGPAKTFQDVRIVPTWCPRNKSLEAFVHTFLGLLHVVARRKDFDIIHIHAIGPSILTPLARLSGLKVVVTNHGPDYDRQKWGRFAKLILRTGENLGTRYASSVIGVSRHICKTLEDKSERTTTYIPNGAADMGVIPPGSVLATHDLKPEQYAIAVGRLVPEKGFHDLITAFSQIETDKKLVIAGEADHDDPYSISLRKSCSEHDGIIMTGKLDMIGLCELYSSACLFVLPSYHEGLPICILEAMRFGLPTLVSSIPANRELVRNESYLFPPGDVDQLKEKMSLLMNAQQKDEPDASIATALRTEFNWDSIADQTASTYKRMFSSHTDL